MPLLAYYKENALAQESNLFSDYDLPSAKSEEATDLKYLPHLKPAVSLYLIYDDSAYMTRFEDANVYLRSYLGGDQSLGLFYPILYASDFWVLRKELQVLNSTDLAPNITTVTIRAGTIAKEYFGYQK